MCFQDQHCDDFNSLLSTPRRIQTPWKCLLKLSTITDKGRGCSFKPAIFLAHVSEATNTEKTSANRPRPL